MAKKVLIGARSFSRSPEVKSVLEAQGYELILNPHERPFTETELVEKVRGVDALVEGNDPVTAAVIAAGSPTLKIIAKQGVGYNNIDLVAAKKSGVAVTVTPGANSRSVADLAFGLMLSLARGISQMDQSIRTGAWSRHTGHELAGKVLGIVGMGNIGGQVAKRACAFDMKVVAYDVYPRQDFMEMYGVTYLPLPEVLAQADYISLHAPALPETVGMINRDSLRTMKKTAYLINTARGDLVVEDDLYAALAQGVIAGAGLDVFGQEPVRDSRFFDLKNVVLTPHTGGYTDEAVIRSGVMVAEEIIRVLSGQEPQYPVRA